MLEIRPCTVEHVRELAELWMEYMIDQGDDPLFTSLDLVGSVKGFTGSSRGI